MDISSIINSKTNIIYDTYVKNKSMYENISTIAGFQKTITMNGGGEKKENGIVEKYLSYIYENIKYHLYEKDHIYRDITHIPSKMKYGFLKKEAQDFGETIANTNCHLGQRKLLLTEIEFYTRCIDNSKKNNIVIYAGSASCEHLPVILKLFPDLKFILVDPNYHAIDGKYSYLYQNTDIIDNGNWKLYKKHANVRKKDKNNEKGIQHSNKYWDRSLHQNKTAVMLENVFFVNTTAPHNVLDIYNEQHIDVMKKIKNKFYDPQNKNVIDSLIESDNVFIIQDYMTLILAQKLKKYMESSKYKHQLYFLTDIRTKISGSESPGDIDILWNGALQIIFLKVLRPLFSMLKHRTPFYDAKEYNDAYEIVKNDAKNTKFEFIMNDINYVKKEYGIDIMKSYLARNPIYFTSDFIYTQPWSPAHSSETRLFVSLKNIDMPFIIYDPIEHENRFYFFRYIRMFKYYPIFYEKLKNYKVNQYDGCFDCAREIQIIANYIIFHNNNIKTTNTNLSVDTSDMDTSNMDTSDMDTSDMDLSNIDTCVIDDVDNCRIIEKKLDNDKFAQKLYIIHDIINKFTFFNLSEENYKCKQHGGMTHQTPYVDFYTYNNNAKQITMYRFDKSGNITKKIIEKDKIKKMNEREILHYIDHLVQKNKKH